MFRFLLLALVLALPARADYAKGVAAWARADYREAAAQFTPCAQAGEAECQYMLGRLYALGDGVERDFVQAWIWQDRAARQGHRDAAAGRDMLSGVLNPAQLAQAKAIPMAPPLPPVAGRQVMIIDRSGVVEQQAAR